MSDVLQDAERLIQQARALRRNIQDSLEAAEAIQGTPEFQELQRMAARAAAAPHSPSKASAEQAARAQIDAVSHKSGGSAPAPGVIARAARPRRAMV